MSTMSVYYFVDPNLELDIFFEKEGATEKWGVDFEIWICGTSAHLHWRL